MLTLPVTITMRLISPVKVLRRVGQWEGLLGRGALWQVCRMVGDQLSIVSEILKILHICAQFSNIQGVFLIGTSLKS